MNPKGPSAVKITPRECEVDAGESKSFKGHGGTPPYTFSFAPAGNVSGGLVDRNTGAYTAGSTAGTDTLRVTDAAGDTDDARITVIPPLTIAPASASHVCGSTQSFHADGGSPPYTFDWAPGGDNTGGSIDPGASPDTGAYVAGQMPGTDRVRVSDAHGNAADAAIEVVAQLQLTATDAAVVVGTSTTLQGTGGTPPYAYTFSGAGNVSGGSVNSTTGAYTAGTTTGTDTIEVTDNSPGRTASITVEVKPALQVQVPDDQMHKVQLGTPEAADWWETWESWGDIPANPSSALEITVATGAEVTLKVVGGVPNFAVDKATPSGGTADSPAAGDTTFTYTAGLTVGGDRRATDMLTITDEQSTANQATVTITVTEKFEDLAALASSGSFKMPFVAYRTWHFFAGFSLHDGVIFPPPPAVPMDGLPCIDAFVLHTTGLQSLPSRGSGERGPVVAPGGAYLIGRGSDAGFVVPHISIPINNILLPIVILLGESKSLFGSSSVRLPCWSVLGGSDECDTACAFPVPWLPVVGLNLACSDEFPLPTDFVVAPSTILVGMSWLDLLAGVIDVALEYIVAVAMVGLNAGAGMVWEKAAKGIKKVGKKAGKEVAEKVVKEGAGVVGDLAEEGVGKAVKKGIGELVEEGGEKLGKKVGGELVEEGGEKLGKKVGGELVEEGGEKLGKKVGGELVEEGGEKLGKKGGGELLEEGAEKAAKKESFWKKAGRQLWADSDEKKRLITSSKSFKKAAADTGLSPDELYKKLGERSNWAKTYDVLKGPVESICLEQPFGWIAGRVGKIDDTLRGLEEFDWDDWWEFGEIFPMVESPIVQTIRPQPPAGEGWWGD